MNKSIERIFSNKIILSGIAILMVMLYHQPPEGLISGIYFYPAFAGVDIFLLLSGFGLCYSFNKYDLLQFYRRRLVRILPMLLLLGFLVSFNYAGYKVWDYFCNMTTLYYYHLGGDIYEWYLASLLLFYLIFPLLYKFSSILFRRNQWLSGGGILFVWCVIMVFVTKFDIPWYYQTALGRLPIFLLGILCFFSIENYKTGLLSFAVVIPILVFLYSKGLVNTFMLVYCVAPILLLLISFLIPTIKRYIFIEAFIDFMGTHSLEVYAANVLISVYIRSRFCGFEATLFYWGAHIVLIPVFCYINKLIATKIIHAN